MLEQQDAMVEIASISFGDGLVEITYQEPSDVTDEYAVVRSLVAKTEKFETQVEVLSDLLRDLLDDILVEMRNPPDTRPGRMTER